MAASSPRHILRGIATPLTTTLCGFATSENRPYQTLNLELDFAIYIENGQSSRTTKIANETADELFRQIINGVSLNDQGQKQKGGSCMVQIKKERPIATCNQSVDQKERSRKIARTLLEREKVARRTRKKERQQARKQQG
ncbi:hypothetical protein Tco_0674476 [Tanacetum coccineum]